MKSSEEKALGKEDGDDMRSKWYCFEDVADSLCAQCHAEGAQSTANHLYNADTCVNCHANGLIEQNTMYKGADRPNIMFDGDTDAFVQHLIVNLFNKKFAEELSQIGGITLDRDSFADYFRSSNGKQLWVDKLSYIVTHSDGTKERKTKFRVWRDYGNDVYASVKSRHTVFSPPTMKRSWEMDWRPFSDSSTSYPTSDKNCWKPRS